MVVNEKITLMLTGRLMNFARAWVLQQTFIAQYFFTTPNKLPYIFLVAYCCQCHQNKINKQDTINRTL